MSNFQLFYWDQAAGGSPTGQDLFRVGAQDIGCTGRPVFSGLQVPGDSVHFRARTKPHWLYSRGVFPSKYSPVAPEEMSNLRVDSLALWTIISKEDTVLFPKNPGEIFSADLNSPLIPTIESKFGLQHPFVLFNFYVGTLMPGIRYVPDCTVARDVTHWFLLLLHHVYFLLLHVKPNFGSVVLTRVLLLTFLIFSNIPTLLSTHLLSTYKAWNTYDINILYHILCL